MNARLDMMNHDNVPAPLADCLRNAAASILRSPTFAKAPRMRQLLAFLIDAPAMASGGGVRLQLASLRDLGRLQGSDAFVWGLDDELRQAVPDILRGAHAGRWCRLRRGGLPTEGRNSCRGAPRARLRAAGGRGAGQVAWISQFDGDGDLGMALQKEFAGAINDGLRHDLYGVAQLRTMVSCAVGDVLVHRAVAVVGAAPAALGCGTAGLRILILAFWYHQAASRLLPFIYFPCPPCGAVRARRSGPGRRAGSRMSPVPARR